MEWCLIQSWLMHCFILSGFFWILLLIALRIRKPVISGDHLIKIDEHTAISYRCIFLFIYLLAGLFATFAVWMNAVSFFFFKIQSKNINSFSILRFSMKIF